MELILILAVGVIVASTSIISPGPKDINKVENTPKIEVSTPEEPKEEVNSEQTQEQDVKPEEETTTIQEEVKEEFKDEGFSILNIILYILGAISVIAAGIYFFMRRESAQSAADIARVQSSTEPTIDPQQEEPAQEKTYSEQEPQPETEQPVQEETQTETTETEENSTSDNTNDQSSNNDDENNNK